MVAHQVTAAILLALVLPTQAAPSTKLLLRQASDWTRSEQWPGCCQHSASLRTFICTDCKLKLTTIPSNIPKDIIAIDLSFNHIGYLRSNSLTGHSALVRLILMGNGLGLISDDAFGGIDRLAELNLEDNRLKVLPSHFPASLMILGLKGNPIREIDSDSFTGLPELYELEVSARKIGPDSFAELNLASLKIETCHIKSHAFRNLAPTFDLVLDNPCKDTLRKDHSLILDPLAFSHFGGDLAGNFTVVIRNTIIKEIPYRAFHEMGPSIKSLRLLNVEGVEFIEPGAISDNSQLEEIIIEGRGGDNALTLLAGIFTGSMPNLRKIDLSDLGSIHSIHGGIFNGLPNLQEIYMDGLDLAYMSPSVILPVEGLKLMYLNVSNNPYKCNCNLRWLKEMLDRASFNWFPAHTTCASPPELAGMHFYELSASDFVCY